MALRVDAGGDQQLLENLRQEHRVVPGAIRAGGREKLAKTLAMELKQLHIPGSNQVRPHRKCPHIDVEIAANKCGHVGRSNQKECLSKKLFVALCSSGMVCWPAIENHKPGMERAQTYVPQGKAVSLGCGRNKWCKR